MMDEIVYISRSFPHRSIFFGKKLYAFDCESFRFPFGENKEKHELANFSIFDGREYIDGVTIQEFLSSIYDIMSREKKVIFFGHNIGYDLSILELVKFFVGTDIWNINGVEYKKVSCLLEPVVFIKYENKKIKSTIEFLDSFNYFKTSLRNIAKMLKLEKYADEEYMLEPLKWNEYIKNNGKELCHRDVLIEYELYKYMLSQSDIIWQISAASSSMTTFLDKFLQRPISIPKQINQEAIKSYRGGRTELYIKSNEFLHLRSYDINSLYPYAMIKHKYSIKYLDDDLSDLVENIRNEKFNYLLNINYEYKKAKPQRLPILIFSEKHKKLIESYHGENIWITGREYLYLIESGADVQVFSGHRFKNAYVFIEYVSYFYEKKSHSTGPAKLFFKLMLNSLYGKFGQHSKHSDFQSYDTEIGQELEPFKDLRTTINYEGINYMLYEDYFTSKIDADAPYSVLIASEITANARLINYDYQKAIGFANVLYTDTDSFFCYYDFKMPEKYIGNEIGQLKNDKTGMFKLFAPKSYIFIDDEDNKKYDVLKGIKKSANKISENTYKQSVFRTIRSKSGFVIVENVIKNLSFKNDKLDFSDGDKGLPYE
jgi:hypothetical protein